jgi:hypothetical protein
MAGFIPRRYSGLSLPLTDLADAQGRAESDGSRH